MDEDVSCAAEPRTSSSPLLTGLVVLLVVVLGAPQVWGATSAGRFGLELLFYPVLAAALGCSAVRRP